MWTPIKQLKDISNNLFVGPKGVHLKLVSFIFPSIYIGLILLNLLFQLDTILAWIAVSVIYLYVTVSQYKIVKRYYN